MHYILWKRGAPRFDLQAQELLDKAAALKKAGLVAGALVECDIKYVVDFFADYLRVQPKQGRAGRREDESRCRES